MHKDTSADGLRGIASLSVMVCHFFISFFPLGFVHLYPGSAGSGALESNITAILNAPLLSLLWNGNLAVSIFFVLSGYVLTKSFFITNDIDIIRLRAAKRYFRFAIPVLMSVLFSWAIMSSGVGVWRQASQISGSIWLGQFWLFDSNIIEAIKEGIYGAILNGHSLYNPTLWTMKIEIFGSFIVFAYTALKRNGYSDMVLFICACVIIFSCDKLNAPYYIAFILGSYINTINFQCIRKYQFIIIVAAIYFSSADTSQSYLWLKDSWWGGDYAIRASTVIGGFIIVLLVANGFGSCVLNRRSVQILGRLSFSIYLVHFPIILSLSSYLYIELHKFSVSVWMIVPNFIATTIVVLAISYLFMRAFDETSTKIANSIVKHKDKKMQR